MLDFHLSLPYPLGLSVVHFPPMLSALDNLVKRTFTTHKNCAGRHEFIYKCINVSIIQFDVYGITDPYSLSLVSVTIRCSSYTCLFQIQICGYSVHFINDLVYTLTVGCLDL